MQNPGNFFEGKSSWVVKSRIYNLYSVSLERKDRVLVPVQIMIELTKLSNLFRRWIEFVL